MSKRNKRNTVSVLAHVLAIRAGDQALLFERDRRYTEVSLARAEALRIKEDSVQMALTLARESQQYREQAHNGLLQQIRDERGGQATKAELIALDEKNAALVKPVLEYIASQRARGAGLNAGWAYLVAALGLLGILFGMFGRFIH